VSSNARVERFSAPMGRGHVEYEADFLSASDANRLERALHAELTFEAREIELFGRRVLQPRLIAWAGELPYRYSGQTLETKPFTPALEELRARVAERTGVRFNHALVNRYRDGRDSMGFHSDAEPELGRDPTVASASFGATRRFLLRPKRKSQRECIAYELVHGSLLVMGGSLQHHYRHGVPRESRPVGARLNVTFRLLLRPPLTPP